MATTDDLRLGRGVQVVSVAHDPSPGRGVRLDDNGKLPASLTSLNGVTGSVGSTGTIVSGTGFTVSHSGTGVYAVTFTRTLSAIPIVVATVTGAGGSVFWFDVSSPATTGFTFNSKNSAGAAFDVAWNFLALIPQ